MKRNSKPKIEWEPMRPMPLSRYEEMLDELRLRLSRIEEESRYDYDFVRRLLAEKQEGKFKPSGVCAQRIWILWQQYVKHGPPPKSAKQDDTATTPEEAA